MVPPPPPPPEPDPRDAADRGLPPDGGRDSHHDSKHTKLPPADPNYQPSGTAGRVDELLAKVPPLRRIQTLFPFLLVRAVPGDTGGGRPLWEPTVCWESCDIHLMPDDGGPFDFTKTVANPVAGATYRVFVHVWNLGRLGAYAARLRAWWVEPGFFDGTANPLYTPHFIGGSYFDLGDRDTPLSHRLIEVTPGWKVVMNQPAHECLIVAVDSATDPWDGSMDANRRRHVAQRNLTLVAAQEDISAVITQLARAVPGGHELLVASAAVTRASLDGAAEAGAAASARQPRGWTHATLAPDADSRPVLAITSEGEGGGLRSHDLHESPPLSQARPVLGEGTAIDGELPQALPGLLQAALRADDLSAAAVARAITGTSSKPALLRLALTDPRSGATGGYTVMVLPEVDEGGRRGPI